MYILRFAKRVYKDQKVRFSLSIIALFLGGLTESAGIALLLPLLRMITNNGAKASTGKVGHLTKSILAAFGVPFNLVSVLSFILTVIIAQQVIMLIQQKLAISTQVRFETGLRERTYRAIFEAKWPFFVQTKLGHITDALSTEMANCGQAARILTLLLSGVLVSVVYLMMSLILSWQVTLIILIGGSMVMLLSWRQTAKGKIFGLAITKANQEFQDEIIEQVSAAKLIKGYAAQDTVIARFRSYYEELARSRFQGSFNQARSRALMEAGMATMLVIAIYVAVTLLKVDIGGLMIILFIFYRVAPRLSNTQTLLHNLNILIPAIQRVDFIAGQALGFKESNGTRQLKCLKKGIMLKNVDFSYDSATIILRKVNLEIPKGKTIAVVGSSGVGKSTVVDLVIGLIEPTKGELLLDGIPINEYDSKSWKQKIGYVAQDTILFNDTVEKNIAWPHSQANPREIIKAAKMAYAHEFIERLPEGYQTVIGARGMKLSGGQRQRLALARAILRKPELLILDEATSSLDAVSEKKIQTAVEALSETMTILIVTHRLATIRNADYIYVLDSGEMVEQGTWRELIEEQGMFQEQRRLQAVS